MEYIKRNLEAVQAELAEAAARAGREDHVSMIAAVKYATDEELAALLDLGVTDVGENRVQQLLLHYPQYENSNVRVHFIGTLQKNKIKYIIDKVYAIHSVDSVALAREIDRHAVGRGVRMRVYAEVNIGREEAKSGVMPEAALDLCREILALENLELVGLMTMAPRCESEAEYRAYFAALCALAGDIEKELALATPLALSMGMSESFTAAVLEGASSVRVGRRLFAK